MAIQQPKWALPQRQAEEPVLKVYNSLTRTKVCPILRALAARAPLMLAWYRRSSWQTTGDT